MLFIRWFAENDDNDDDDDENDENVCLRMQYLRNFWIVNSIFDVGH